jgi:hypothetical protein
MAQSSIEQLARAEAFPPAAVAAPSITVRGTSGFEWMFVILGGLPLYLPVLFFLGERGLGGQDPIYWYFWVNAAISSPHVWSTYARLGRKIGERKVPWWMGLPLYLVIFGALAAASKAGHFVEAMTAVNLWQSFHYCRQVYGVSKLVSRNGRDDDLTRRLLFHSYHLAVPLFVLGRWDTLYTVWHGQASPSIIPVRIASWILGLCWALAGAGALSGLWAEWRTYRRLRQEGGAGGASYNVARLVTLAIYYAIHIFGFLSVTFYQRGFFAVTIFHAVQYLGIVWTMERRVNAGPTIGLFRWVRVPALAAFPVFWMLMFVVGYTMENRVFMGANRWWPLLATVGLAAISAHHYSVDSVMWRRKAGA